MQKKDNALPSVSRARVCILYVHGVSESIWRILIPLGFQTVIKRYCTLRALFIKPKGSIMPDAESGIVSKIRLPTWRLHQSCI